MSGGAKEAQLVAAAVTARTTRWRTSPPPWRLLGSPSSIHRRVARRRMPMALNARSSHLQRPARRNRQRTRRLCRTCRRSRWWRSTSPRMTARRPKRRPSTRRNCWRATTRQTKRRARRMLLRVARAEVAAPMPAALPGTRKASPLKSTSPRRLTGAARTAASSSNSNAGSSARLSSARDISRRKGVRMKQRCSRGRSRARRWGERARAHAVEPVSSPSASSCRLCCTTSPRDSQSGTRMMRTLRRPLAEWPRLGSGSPRWCTRAVRAALVCTLVPMV
mmetsp:Transcript_9562/g.39301  ORF Transcript_9562/g.39301 Transcript_9562/m.39301 type:complete len:278 (+) Transcript_9562:366-1199(+)